MTTTFEIGKARVTEGTMTMSMHRHFGHVSTSETPWSVVMTMMRSLVHGRVSRREAWRSARSLALRWHSVRWMGPLAVTVTSTFWIELHVIKVTNEIFTVGIAI